MSFLKYKCEFPEQTTNNFACWEVKSEFIDQIKPHEIKKVRQSRQATAQKFYIYSSLLNLVQDVKHQS